MFIGRIVCRQYMVSIRKRHISAHSGVPSRLQSSRQLNDARALRFRQRLCLRTYRKPEFTIPGWTLPSATRQRGSGPACCCVLLTRVLSHAAENIHPVVIALSILPMPTEVNKIIMSNIKSAIIGIGNCASSLIQGIHYYRGKTRDDAIGLMHWEIGGYMPGDIEVVAAFDVDRRKIGLDVNEAIFSSPNCTTVFCEDIPQSGVKVQMGKILDGFSEHMKEYPDQNTFLLADEPEPAREEIIRVLKDSDTEVLINYLPVGSEEATRFYAGCALEAGVAFVNNIPVFIASDPVWAKRFEEKISQSSAMISNRN